MSAARVMKETGCGAIKLEGGRRMAETIAFLVERGVPVMGHVGLTPQSINTIGSFRAQGRDEADWGPIEDDAHAVAEAGAFSRGDRGGGRAAGPPHHRLRSRSRPSASARSAACDGQILVLEDMLGLSPRVPKFVKRYGELGPSHRGCGGGLCDRCSRPCLPRPRACLSGPDQRKVRLRASRA